MIIYKVTNSLNGKVYVGMTKHDLAFRRMKHIGDARRSSSGSIFHAAIRKYGVDAFIWEVIDRAGSMEELKTKEKEWILKVNSRCPEGYNLTEGGDGVVSPSECTLLKRSRSVLMRYEDDNYAKKHRDAVQSYWDNLSEEDKKIKLNKRRQNQAERGTLGFPKAALIAASQQKKTAAWRKKASDQALKKWREDGYKEKWSKSVRGKKAEKKKDFIRCIDNGLVFSSARAGADWCRNNGFPKAARNNLCLCVNGKYKTFCGMQWERIDADSYRDSGGIVIV